MDTNATGPFGAAIRDEWALDPDWLTVNHGAYGATPLAVLAAQARWRDHMEAQPSRFMRRVLPDALRAAAEALGQFVGAAGRDIAFVDNATVGCNAVLRSMALQPGDEIVMLGHTYGAVRNTARYVAGRSGAVLLELPMVFPAPDPAALDALVPLVRSALGPRTRLVILDHVTSPSATVLPIGALVAACRAAGVPVLVDGAHAPGQLALDVAALDADWYVGNCHKWLMAPKGSAFLWARHDRQDGLHPAVISHGYGHGFLAEFDWTGTRDASACLAVPDAIAFHARLGGPALQARNAALARQAGLLLADTLGTQLGNPPGSAMAVVRLPLDGDAGRALALRGRLLDEFSTDLPLHAIDGGIWLRLSAQAYNEVADYEALADRCRALIQTEARP